MIQIPHLFDEAAVPIHEHGRAAGMRLRHEGSVMRSVGLINENPDLLDY
jgi:hypothetical protein